MFYNDDDDDVECFPVCVCGDRLEGIMVMSASLFHTLSLSLFGSINLCDGVHWHIECSNAMTNICRIFSRMDCSAIAIVFNSLYYQHTIPHPYIYIHQNIALWLQAVVLCFHSATQFEKKNMRQERTMLRKHSALCNCSECSKILHLYIMYLKHETSSTIQLATTNVAILPWPNNGIEPK